MLITSASIMNHLICSDLSTTNVLIHAIETFLKVILNLKIEPCTKAATSVATKLQ